MIALPRSMARQFRAVLRRCGSGADYRRDPLVVARSGTRGVSLEAVSRDADASTLIGRCDRLIAVVGEDPWVWEMVGRARQAATERQGGLEVITVSLPASRGGAECIAPPPARPE